MNFERTKNAKRTIISGIIVKILSIIIPFIMRTIIIYSLGNLYLGLGSLFSSVLNTLSLAELGISSAMVFSMYKPVADNDTVKICALLNVYKKINYLIGIVIVIAGIVLIPFLPKLISGAYPDGINIYVLFSIQLLSTVSGYFFFAYKGSVLIAYQRMDIANYIAFITEIVMYVLQIISLVVLKNYYIYVILILLKSIVYNIVVSLFVKKRYPELTAKGSIDKETKKQILKKTGALVGHQIAVVVINSTDNILISMFIGLNMVAVYNNYYYVVTAVSGVLLLVYNNMNSIVGNYLISESSDNINRLFETINYLNAFIISICCTCLVNMYQPFITIWTGAMNTFPFYMVILFTGYFYSLRIRIVLNLFENAAGIWEKDFHKTYIMTAINLLIDIILIQKIGIAAALISTIVSMIFAFIYETIVVHKYVLKTWSKRFFAMSIVYFISTVISCIASVNILLSFPILNSIFRLFLGGVVSVVISCLCFILLTFWCKEFKYSINFLKNKLLNLS